MANNRLSRTQLDKNLQGKEFRGHSALNRFKEQLGKHLNQKNISQSDIKKFIKADFALKSDEYITKFLRDRLKLNEAQRPKVISMFRPTKNDSPAEMKRQERVSSVIRKDQIVAGREVESHLAKSNLHTVLAGEAANVKTGFAGAGQRNEKKIGLAAGKQKIVGITGDHNDSLVGNDKNNSESETPKAPIFDF